MRSIQEVVKRIDARLAAIERQRRERPDWLTRLMLDETDPARQLTQPENATDPRQSPSQLSG